MKELKDRLNELQKKAEDYDRVDGELRKAKELLKVHGQAVLNMSTECCCKWHPMLWQKQFSNVIANVKFSWCTDWPTDRDTKGSLYNTFSSNRRHNKYLWWTDGPTHWKTKGSLCITFYSNGRHKQNSMLACWSIGWYHLELPVKSRITRDWRFYCIPFS